MNYFELFKLPIAPTVDKSMLPKTYFELQKKYHPDFFSDAGEDEKEEVLQQSANINKAFKIFQQSEKTLEYFLQLTGIITTDEKYELSPGFLMEMMDINESLAEDADLATKEVAAYNDRLWDEIEPTINNYGKVSATEAELQKLKAYYYKKKYLNRILDRLAD